MSTDNFQWTDELVAEYGQFYHLAFNNMKNLGKCMMKEFKTSKQKPKEWEIISYVNELGGIVTKNEPSAILSLGLKCKIRSVRRLSDGEVFTIGHSIGDGFLSSVILNIEVRPNGDCVLICDKGAISIRYASKTRQPLFTTDDGKPIYEGDSYVKVNNWSIVTGFVATGMHEVYQGLNFSTKEAAEEYILMNKPCLSVSDVLETSNYNPSAWAFEELKKLAKSKLQ